MAKSIAQELAKKQKEISVSEFFEKNKHILGFGSSTRAILTSVKEAVDNSLDACEEAGILPEVHVTIDELENEEFEITVEDNGPGIVKKQIPNVFGKLLYGSRFHAIRQSRGQQGIGISAVVLYGQLTTGRPTLIHSKTSDDDVAAKVSLMINTKKNKPEVVDSDFVPWEKEHGTKVKYTIKGRYVRSHASVEEYLKGTAIVNPHASIFFKGPDNVVLDFERVTVQPPPACNEIKPHPRGLELGQLMAMAKHTKSRRIKSFLNTEFSRISYRVADDILEKADVPENRSPKYLKLEEAKAILKAIDEVKIMSPPTDCLSPIGEVLIKKGLKNVLGDMKPDYYVPPVTRSPEVYQGNPFQAEVGMVFGGDLPKDGQVEILRFANRVPLLYQQGSDVMTKALSDIDWRRYGLEQRGGKGIPYGPAVILIHVASTKIPFTSEAKEAVADIETIKNEVILALRDVGRKTRSHLNKKKKKKKAKAKFDLISRVLPEIAKKSADMLDKPVPNLDKTITKIMGVVWIDDKIEYDKDTAIMTVAIQNFTTRSKTFDLNAILPAEKIDIEGSKDPPDKILTSKKAAWKIKKLGSAKTEIIEVKFKGVDKDEYDENDFFVDGVNPTIVLGAEPLPGDWNLDIDPKNVKTIKRSSSGKKKKGESPKKAKAKKTKTKAEEVVEEAEGPGGQRKLIDFGGD